MGLKFLRLHMIPWCFHMMGHHISCVQFPRDQKPTGTIKLIKSDGVVKIYKKPIQASQIMLEFPKHMVCSSDSFYIGQKIIPLSGNDKLHLGHSYFLLPTHSFQTVLTFVNLASFASAANSLMSSKAKGNCQPFDITKTPSGCLKIRVSEEFISQLIVEKVNDDDDTDEDEDDNNDKREIQAYKGKGKRRWKNKREVVSKNSKNRVCTTAQLKKDYTQMVGSKREWKPKLEMIRERGEKKRKLSSFGMKRIKKKSQILVGTHKNRHHHHASSSTSSTSSTSSSFSSAKSQCKNKVKKFV